MRPLVIAKTACELSYDRSCETNYVHLISDKEYICSEYFFWIFFASGVGFPLFPEIFYIISQ